MKPVGEITAVERRLQMLIRSETTVRVLYLWIPTVVIILWWARIRRNPTAATPNVGLIVTLGGIAFTIYRFQTDLFNRENHRFVYAFFPVYFFVLIMLPQVTLTTGSLQVLISIFQTYVGIRLTPSETTALVLGALLAFVEVRRVLPPSADRVELSDVTLDFLTYLMLGLILILQFTLLYWFAAPIGLGPPFNPDVEIVAVVTGVFLLFLITLFYYQKQWGTDETRIRVGGMYMIGISGFAFATPYLRGGYSEFFGEVFTPMADPVTGVMALQILITGTVLGSILMRVLVGDCENV